MVRDVVEGVGWGRGVFLSAGDLEPFFKNFWGSEPYDWTSNQVLKIDTILDACSIDDISFHAGYG